MLWCWLKRVCKILRVQILSKHFDSFEKSEFSEKIRKNNGGIRRKTDISWLLKALESYIWYQMIARTMFYNHVISNININYCWCMYNKEIVINKRKIDDK